MKARSLSCCALLCLLLGLSACQKQDTTALPAPPQSVPVQTQSVSRGSISTEHRLSGSVLSNRQEQVHVSTNARCSNVSLKVGDIVQAGQTLFTLDLTSYHENYALAQTNLQNAQSNRRDQEQLLNKQIEQLQEQYADTLALFDIGVVSEAEVEALRYNIETSELTRDNTLAQLDVAIQNAQNNLTQLADSIHNISSGGAVTAPIRGILVSFNAANNAFVAPGQPVAVIDSLDDMTVKVLVSEQLIAKLQLGQVASVSLTALGQTFDAPIEKLAPTPDPQTRLYAVSLRLPAGLEGVLAGMFAEVTFYTDSRENSIVIPTEALLIKEDGQYVVTLDENQIAHRVLVETGLIGDGVTEITAGLWGGETLVTVGQSYLDEGESARIVSDDLPVPEATQEGDA